MYSVCFYPILYVNRVLKVDCSCLASIINKPYRQIGLDEIATASFLNANTIVKPDSIGDVANLVTCKLKLLFEILKSFYFTTLMCCAIGRTSPAAKCFRRNICTINKSLLLALTEHETDGSGETFLQVS